jgi:hypothetical protein
MRKPGSRILIAAEGKSHCYYCEIFFLAGVFIVGGTFLIRPLLTDASS